MDEPLVRDPDAKRAPRKPGAKQGRMRRASALAMEAIGGGVEKGTRTARRASALMAEGLIGEDLTQEDEMLAAKPKISTQEATTAMILNCVGASVTVFPKVMANMGYVISPVLSLFCCLAILECGCALANACTLREQTTLERITSFEELAFSVAGKGGKTLVVITKNFALTGFVVVYLQFVVEGVGCYFPEPKPMSMIRYCIVLPVFAFLGMVTNLKQLAAFAMPGTIAVILECGGIILGGLMAYFYYTPACEAGVEGTDCTWYSYVPQPDNPPEWPGISGSAVAVFLFSFAILTTVPTVRSNLVEPKEMPKVLRNAFLTVAVINIIVMCSGFVGYGENAADNIIPQIAKTMPKIGSVTAASIVFSLLYSTVLVIFCVISIFESFTSKYKIGQQLTCPNVCFRIAFVAFLAFCSDMVPYVMQVIGLVSSVFSVCNNIFLPLVFYHVAARRTVNGPSKQSTPISCGKFIFHAAVFLIGIMVLIFGFEGSLKTLLDKIKADAAKGSKA